MINVNDKKIKNVISEFNEGFNRKCQRNNTENEEIILESRIISIICEDFEIEPKKCAIKLNEMYGYNLTGYDVIEVLRKKRLANPNERKDIFQYAKKVADFYIEGLKGDKNAFDKFEKYRKEPPSKNYKRNKLQDKIIVLMIFKYYPEIDKYNCLSKLYSLGDTLSRYFLYDMSDAISNTYGFEKNIKKTEKYIKQKNINNDELLKRVNYLENSLEQTNFMLQDLQDEFKEELEMNKVKELTDFFAKLNSEKYGFILDELLSVNKGISVLRKKNYELPLEINGLLIMSKKLIQFIRDNRIEPIMKINSVIDVKLEDIEYCNYDGTPFKSNNDVKTVRVVSSGWIYKDKGIQISRPKFKEELK